METLKPTLWIAHIKAEVARELGDRLRKFINMRLTSTTANEIKHETINALRAAFKKYNLKCNPPNFTVDIDELGHGALLWVDDKSGNRVGLNDWIEQYFKDIYGE